MSRQSQNSKTKNSEDAGGGQLHQVVAQFLAAVDSGCRPNREKIIEGYPELADDLRSFFRDHDRAAAEGENDTSSAPRSTPLHGTDPSLPPDDNGPESPTLMPQAPATTPSRRSNGGADASTLPRSSSTDGTAQIEPPGPCFGDYELLEEIARGGMGVVYRARQTSLNRVVALKMILAGEFASEQDVLRFQAEAQAAANLDHPGIVPIYEVGQHGGQHFFSMSFVEGHSLADAIAQGQILPDIAARIVRAVAVAVQYAHERGVIHRDLKPANVLIDSHNVPRVTDFGLAKRVGTDSNLTATGAIIGTPGYMAPEQASGAKDVGPPADIYSLGAILYALLTGEPPFRAGTDLDTILQVLEDEPVSPRRLNRAVDRNLETICLKCLEKDPRRRYDSAQDLAEDLHRYLEGEPIVARPVGIGGRLLRSARRNPALAATLIALSLFYANHLFAYAVLQASGETREFHYFVTGLAFVWAAAATLFQYLVRRPHCGAAAIYGWAGMDVLLFTCLLMVADGPNSTILFAYLILVAGAALRFRVALVWFVTLLCMAAYLALVADAFWHRPHLMPPTKGMLPFLLGIMTMGLIGHFLLGRLRKLGPTHVTAETQHTTETQRVIPVPSQHDNPGE